MGSITINGQVVTNMFIDDENPQVLRIETAGRGNTFSFNGLAETFEAGGVSDSVLTVNPATREIGIISQSSLGTAHRETGTVTTTDATPTTLLTIPITDERVARITARVICRDQATTSAQRAFYTLESLVFREAGGNATVQGTVNQETVIESSGAMNATVTVSGNNALITVTGLASTTINWDVEAEIKELA